MVGLVRKAVPGLESNFHEPLAEITMSSPRQGARYRAEDRLKMTKRGKRAR